MNPLQKDKKFKAKYLDWLMAHSAESKIPTTPNSNQRPSPIRVYDEDTDELLLANSRAHKHQMGVTREWIVDLAMVSC
jgi:hypothetical protein